MPYDGFLNARAIHSVTLVMVVDCETYHDARFSYALTTAAVARQRGLQCVVLNASGSDAVARLFEIVGARVVATEKTGVGPLIREAICAGLSHSKFKDPILFILGPEHYDLLRFVPLVAEPILDGRGMVSFPSRTPASFETFPLHRIEHDRTGNELVASRFGYTLDAFLGAVAFTTAVAGYFLNYDAQSYGTADRLDALFVPPFLASKDGVPVVGVQVDFRFPPALQVVENASPHSAVRYKAFCGDCTESILLLAAALEREQSRMAVS